MDNFLLGKLSDLYNILLNCVNIFGWVYGVFVLFALYFLFMFIYLYFAMF